MVEMIRKDTVFVVTSGGIDDYRINKIYKAIQDIDPNDITIDDWELQLFGMAEVINYLELDITPPKSELFEGHYEKVIINGCILKIWPPANNGDGFVISDDSGWLPGEYPSREEAIAAYKIILEK